MRNFIPAKKRVDVSPGESVRIIRELQGLTQSELSALCGIPQTTISGIENGRVNLGVERAKTLATALECHPAVLVFPGWHSTAGGRSPKRRVELIPVRPIKKMRGFLKGIDTSIEREDGRL